MSSVISHYLAEYESIQQYLPGYQTTILRDYRAQVLAQFARIGLPSMTTEDWRYFARLPVLQSLFRVLPSDFMSAATTQSMSLPTPFHPTTIRLVFINGYFAAWLSNHTALAHGLSVMSLAQFSVLQPEQVVMTSEALPAEMLAHGWTALNTVFSQDGAVITIDADQSIDTPIELLFLSDDNHRERPLATLRPIRNLIRVGAKSRVRFVERYLALGEEILANKEHVVCTNVMTTLTLEADAQVDWCPVIQEAQSTVHIGQLAVSQQVGSHLNVFTIAQGGASTRRMTHIHLAGIHATCVVKGLSLTHQHQQIDHQVTVLHQAAHTESEAHYRAIAAGQSRTAFGGAVKVSQGATKIKAQQSSHNLLLSQQAEIVTRPQLNIFASDIVCTHGATVGQLDEAALFYLQSRGLPISEARALLITAFMQVILNEMPLLNAQAEQQAILNHLITEMSHDITQL